MKQQTPPNVPPKVPSTNCRSLPSGKRNVYQDISDCDKGGLGGAVPQEVKSIEIVLPTKYRNSLLGWIRPQTPYYHNAKDPYIRHVWPRAMNCHWSVKTDV